MLRTKGDSSYGDSQSDIREEIAQYSAANGYAARHFADARCGCGVATFRLLLDEDEGVAVRQCVACDNEHPMADGAEYLEDAELTSSICVCDAEAFEITVGVALYEDSEDVKWLYIGCRCPACGLVGVYGDWKSEFNDYRKLLAAV